MCIYHIENYYILYLALYFYAHSPTEAFKNKTKTISEHCTLQSKYCSHIGGYYSMNNGQTSL